MITPSFGLTATERVLPRLALDFTTANLDPRVTFTRTGNTATVTNSSGFVVPINADLPRFDFSPTTLACNGLLIEESRTNLLLNSAQLNQINWGVSQTTVSVDDITSPANTLTADKITESTATNVFHTIFQYAAAVGIAGVAYTLSIFAKPAGRTAFTLQIDGGGFGTGNCAFDVSSGVASTPAGTASNARIIAYPNGWYRCSIVVTSSGSFTGVGLKVILLNASGLQQYTGDGTSGLYLWGAQIEAGAFSTSYIPTAASQVTRNADVATMTGTNFSSWYTATTGAAVVWSIPQTATGTRPLVQFDDTTALEVITLRGNVANPEMYIVDGGAAQAQIDAGTIVANTAYKLSGAWNTNNCAAAKDGAAAVTDNTATIPTLTQLRIGPDGVNYASALIQKIMYYPQRIINAEVQAISK